MWTPSTSLEPDVTHYGLQIIVDGTGQYQYSTQFGISNPSFSSATSHSTTTSQHTNTATREHTATATGDAPETTATTASSPSSDSHIQGPTYNATTHSATTPVVVISTLSLNATHLTGPTAPHPTIASTGTHQNSTHLRGTKTMTVPKTLLSPSAKRTTKTNHVIASATGPASSPSPTSAATSSPAAAATGGAAQLRAAGGLIAALAATIALIL